MPGGGPGTGLFHQPADRAGPGQGHGAQPQNPRGRDTDPGLPGGSDAGLGPAPAAVLKAGRGRLALVWYAAKNGHWQPQSEPQVVVIDEFAERIEQPILVCGELDGDERHTLAKKRKLVHLASPAQSVRRPSFLAELAWERWKQGKTSEVVSLAPIYLHVVESIPT